MATELALAVVASAQIYDSDALRRMWGLDRDVLRQMLGLLILSEANDQRQTLDSTGYSSNPDEARVQALVAVAKVLEPGDSALAMRMNSAEFEKAWGLFSSEMVNGLLTGLARVDAGRLMAATADRIAELTPRSRTILDEFIARMEKMGDVSPAAVSGSAPADVLAKARSLQVATEQHADRLCDMLLPKMDLSALGADFEAGLKSLYLEGAIAYVAQLMMGAKIAKDPRFTEKDEFKAFYGLVFEKIKKLIIEDFQRISGRAEPQFDAKAAEAAKKLIREAEDAFIYWTTHSKSDPNAEVKMVVFLFESANIEKERLSELLPKIQQFNREAMAALMKV